GNAPKRLQSDPRTREKCQPRSAQAGTGFLAAACHFPYHARLASFASLVLIVDPTVGLFEPRAQRGVRLPAEVLLDERVVAVASVHALGSAQIVVSFKPDAGKALRQVHQLIDGDGLARTEVDGFQDFRLQDQPDALDAVVDEHEAAGLIARSPDLDLMSARKLCFNHFAADRRGRLFAAAVPRTPRTINVVETRYARV